MSRVVRKTAATHRRRTRKAAARPKMVRRPSSRNAPSSIEVAQAESLRAEIERLGRGAAPNRWNANPDDVQRSVVKLVLTLVEFLRQVLERQAIRRMDAATISADETEAIGLALMRLEDTIRSLGAQFNLTPEDLELDLGPIGRLL